MNRISPFINAQLSERDGRILAALPDAAIVVDPRYAICLANKAFLRLAGYERDEVIGRNGRFLYGADTDRDAILRIGAAVTAGVALQTELLGYRRDGTPFRSAVSITPIPDDFANVPHLLMIFRAANAPGRDGEERRTTRAALRLAADAAGAGIWELDPASGKIDRDDRMFEIYGQSPAEFPPDLASWERMIHPDDLAGLRAGLERAYGGQRANMTFRIVRPNGELRHLHSLCAQLEAGDGASGRLVGVEVDVTSQLEAGRQIRQAKERIELAERAANFGVWDWHADIDRLNWDDHMYEVVGVSKADFKVSLQAWERLIHPDDLPGIRKAYDQAVAQRTPYHAAFRIRLSDGSTRYLEEHGIVKFAADGTPKRVVGINCNVTDRALAEQRLRDGIDSLESGLELYDRANRLVLWNKAFERKRPGTAPFLRPGLTVDDVVALVSEHDGVPLDADGRTAWIEERLGSFRKTGESQVQHLPDGRVFLVNDHKTAEGGTVSVHTDITQVVLQQQTVAESEARLKALLDSTLVGIISIEEDGRISTFNHEAEAIFGYSAADMLGQPLDRLLPAAVRNNHRHLIRDFRDGAEGSRKMSDWRVVRGIRRDGGEVPLMAVISRVEVAGRATMTAVFRDMTDIQEKEAELLRIAAEKEAAFQHADTASRAKSAFLAIMSHELRTPLNAIIGFSGLLRDEAFGPIANERYKSYIDDIHGSGEHLLGLINDILDMSRIEYGQYEFQIEPLSAGGIVQEAMRGMAPPAAVKGISLTNPESIPAPMVMADARGLRKALMNLVSNAIKFTDSGGEVILSVDRGPANDEVSIIVVDNGRGIPAERLKDLGTPFMQIANTYRRDAGGLGLGLAICRALVGGMGGKLEISSELGKGTRVRIVLPHAERS